jgi:hypothetical protein
VAIAPIRNTKVNGTISDLLSPACGALLGAGADRIAQMVPDGVRRATARSSARPQTCDTNDERKMTPPSRTELLDEVIDLREKLDAITRAWDNDDMDLLEKLISDDDESDEDPESGDD